MASQAKAGITQAQLNLITHTGVVTMYALQVESVSVDITKYSIFSESELLQYDQVIALWTTDFAFRTFFIEVLSAAPYRTYRFETPPVCKQKSADLFEFVLIDSPELDVKADLSPFAEHITSAQMDVVDFDNLAGDARLVVPCPQFSDSVYPHIAAFMRQAPQSQKHNLIQRVARCLMHKLNQQTVWLNTAGGGVDWLHVRLDSRPKYYVYHPYKIP